jgi:UPF0755 protein
MMRMKKIIFFIVLLGVTFVIVLFGGVQLVNLRLNSKVTINQNTEFEVVFGDTWEQILDNLEKQNIFTETSGVSLYLRFQDVRAKKGSYTITPEMDLNEVVSLISKGGERKELTITIPEGSYISDIAQEVEEVFDIPSAEFIRAVEDFDTQSFSFVPTQLESLEGFLFPDTYSFFVDVTSQEIIATMLSTFQRKALPVFQNRTNNLSEYQTLILASIVEKEVFKADERAIVAGIFMNRLNISMMLQSDATVNYLTRSGRDRSTLDDLAIDSEYNTYKYRGLPPGPISNPGVAAIEAAARPEKTDYFYFLTTPWPNSQTFFSKTFEQHVQYKNQYLK